MTFFTGETVVAYFFLVEQVLLLEVPMKYFAYPLIHASFPFLHYPTLLDWLSK